MYNGIYKERYIGLVTELGLSCPRESWVRISVFFSSNVSSSFETPLALVLEDDVLDLRLVLKNALARILRLFHLKRNRYATNAMKRLRDHRG